MNGELKVVWAVGLVVFLLLMFLVFLAPRRKATPPSRENYYGGPEQIIHDGGPYNLQLYDAVRMYPYYDGRGELWWDTNSRCSTVCRGCHDPGESSDVPGCCTTWCR